MSKNELAVNRVTLQNKELVKGLSFLRNNEVFTDVTLVVEGKEIKPCHRYTLFCTIRVNFFN